MRCYKCKRHLVTTLCEACRSWPLKTGGASPSDGAAQRIDSPGEYKLASSWAPACCGPHLAEARAGPSVSVLGVSTPHRFSLTILAISLLWAQPLQSLSLSARSL